MVLFVFYSLFCSFSSIVPIIVDLTVCRNISTEVLLLNIQMFSLFSLLLTVLTSRIEIGKTAFQKYAPFVWKEFQSVHNLHSLPCLDIFLNDLETYLTEQCHCI